MFFLAHLLRFEPLKLFALFLPQQISNQSINKYTIYHLSSLYTPNGAFVKLNRILYRNELFKRAIPSAALIFETCLQIIGLYSIAFNRQAVLYIISKYQSENTYFNFID